MTHPLIDMRARELRDWMLVRGHSRARAERFAKEYRRRQLKKLQ